MDSDYKDEFLPRLEKSLLYRTLKSRCKKKDSEVIALVDSGVYYALQRTKTIIKHMGEFTLHDGDHLFRVLTIMEELLTKATIEKLSEPELMLLILTAFFHDIGMAPDEKQVITWKKIWDANPELEDSESKDFDDFQRFLSVKLEQAEIINRLIAQGKNTQADTIKCYLITEFIRQTHAERAKEIIKKDWNNKILFRDTDLTVHFAQICFSHNEDALELMDFDMDFLCAENTYACYPLIGVVLRLADILDFDGKRTPEILFSHLYVRNPVSIEEWNKHRAVKARHIKPDIIQFTATCKHPVIEAAIHKFCDLIDHELSVCNNIVSVLNDFNKSKNRNIIVRFPFKVNRAKILTQTDIDKKPLYLYRNTQFNLSKKQVVDLLMGTKLYGNPEVALRELLQNSMDACRLRQAQEKKWGNSYNPLISVRYLRDGEDMILEVEDNGTGMDQDVIDNYYSKVGSSFYKSQDFYKLAAEAKADFKPTSRFGIGILSCFMVADTLIVNTKRITGPYKTSEALTVTVEGQESIFLIQSGEKETPGTLTKLLLRKNNPWKNDDRAFVESIQKVVSRTSIPIVVQTATSSFVLDEKSFKKATPHMLKDYTWKTHENVRVFEIPLEYSGEGIVGSALMAVLESNGKPLESVNLTSRDITIDNSIYSLEKHLSLDTNSFKQTASSIVVGDDGDINKEESTSYLARSQSRISLHGIEIPSSLFPDFWERKENQVKISFPFPLILVVDICGKRDLDLNSARTEILVSEKWVDFEENLAYMLCYGIRKLVSTQYWIELEEIYQTSKNQNFLRGLSKLNALTEEVVS